MRHTNTQTMPNIMVINDFVALITEPSCKDVQQILDSLFHWDFPSEEEAPCGKLSLDAGEFLNQLTDEQEWQNDYTDSIRL